MRAHGTELVYRRTRTVERVLSAWLAPETRAARYREIVLREGERIALLGEIVREPDPATPAARQPSLRVVFGDVPSGVILSNESAAWAG